jgi:hypothetical protein
MTQVFISHPTPHTPNQKTFLKLIDDKLAACGLNPVNLGKKNWNFKKPMAPIQEMMRESKGAIIVGLERSHSYIGYDKEDTTNKEDRIEFVHRYSSTPWVHIEAGMAYQAGLPMLILKEKRIHAEGILDPNNSESYIFEFLLEKNLEKLSYELDQIIESWVQEVLKT